jgi:GT2 family glycosyltransferase
MAGNNHALRAGLDRGVDAMLLLCDDFQLAPDALERLAERMEQRPLEPKDSDRTVAAHRTLRA